jgi:hypothetical protein
MSPKSDRAAIAAALRTALPDWTVFTSPPEVGSAPCIAILPRTPYRELLTYTEERMHLQLVVVVQRAAGTDLLDLFDDTFDAVLAALDAPGTPECAWSSIEVRGAEEVNGIEYLTASIDLDVF